MVAESVQRVVRDYLRAATRAGIPTRKAVVFGSHATGRAHAFSDIDLVVLSPALEPPRSHDLIAALWRLRGAGMGNRRLPRHSGNRPAGGTVIEVP